MKIREIDQKKNVILTQFFRFIAKEEEVSVESVLT